MAVIMDDILRGLLFIGLLPFAAALGAGVGYLVYSRTAGARNSPSIRASSLVGAAGGVNALALLDLWVTRPLTLSVFAANLVPGMFLSLLIGGCVGAVIAAYRTYASGRPRPAVDQRTLP
jgi:hypothetical protein